MAMKPMENEKSYRRRQIVDILKETGSEAIKILTDLFNVCITLCDVLRNSKEFYHDVTF